MRVISGKARGLKLDSPKGYKTRPTTDYIKESLFNMISSYLMDCVFLDLFSGTGAIGIEALSRGAKNAVFVDNDFECIDIIKKNLVKAKFQEKAFVLNKDAMDCFNYLYINKYKFDIIFMDPPYKKIFINTVLKNICDFNILNKNGFIICEQSSQSDLPCEDNFKIFKTKNYKTTSLIFLR